MNDDEIKKELRRKYKAAYKLKYPEKYKEQRKRERAAYKKAHPEKIKEQKAAYKEKHPEKIAEQRKRYKEKYKERHGKEWRRGWDKNRYKSSFELAKFIGIDGEGRDVTLPDGTERHIYTYLASNTDDVYNVDGLTSKQCFDFLIQQAAEHKQGVFCIFSGSYDANLWMCDLNEETLREVLAAEGKYYINYLNYGICYVPRRYFMLKDFNSNISIKVWDVWGFFQGSFISALRQWLPNFDRLDLIIEGKQKRVAFTEDDYAFMCQYNQAELDALVMMMERLREAVQEMGLKLKGWHGAGALASAIYQDKDIKAHLAHAEDEVYIASKHAYFGGRIELGKYGTYHGSIYHYDINSAYPAQQRHLPSLAQGRWVKRPAGFDTRTTNNICIASIEWNNIIETAFCPFPYRTDDNRVIFPDHGKCWVYKPELDAALKWRDKKYHFWDIEILCAYEFVPDDGAAKPFDFIDEYYSHRQLLVAESKRSGVPNGQEKAIKLGLNSLYGKTAQRIGYNPKTGRIPPYHNLIYAGYITAATRAQLYDACMQAPDKIICMATDGIYSQVPLELDCPDKKMLGAWEYQKHAGMVMVQSGFYFLIDEKNGEQVINAFSRGFDRMTSRQGILDTLAIIQTAWKHKQDAVYLPCTRFITLQSALIGKETFKKWCTWHKTQHIDKAGHIYDGRRLAITPKGTKRQHSDSKLSAHKNMLATEPTQAYDCRNMSEPHDIPWDSEGVDDYIIDAEHIDNI